MRKTLLLLTCLLATGLAHAEAALTARATELVAQARSDAAVVASLPENPRVEVLGRKGAWSEVSAGGQSGWVRMTSIKPLTSAAGTTAPANPLGALNNLLSSGRTSNTATVTTGVRGLSEEDLQNAQANPDELKKMQQFTVERHAAEGFARRSKLEPIQLDELPAPAPVQNNNNYNPVGG